MLVQSTVLTALNFLPPHPPQDSNQDGEEADEEKDHDQQRRDAAMRPAVHIHRPPLAPPTACRPFFLHLVSKHKNTHTHTHCIYQALQLCHSCWILEQGLVFSSMWPPLGREQFFYRVVAYFCLTLNLPWAHLRFNSGGFFFFFRHFI